MPATRFLVLITHADGRDLLIAPVLGDANAARRTAAEAAAERYGSEWATAAHYRVAPDFLLASQPTPTAPGESA